MRKSKKLTKITNKRFSKNKRFSRNKRVRTKYNKLVRTRKITGGNRDEDGITFVGFSNNSPSNLVGPFIPIFLLNNLEYNPQEPGNLKFSNVFASRDLNYNKFSFSHIILPQIYKLKKIRGLVLRSCLKGNVYFYDENGKPIIDNRFVPTGMGINDRSSQWENAIPNNPDGTKYKDIIREVELKYPGLFQLLYITPPEQQQALQRIQEKELEERENEKKTSPIEENQEIQEIKNRLDEIQKKMSGKEEIDEEKQATYSREMEETNQMIPYLRAEQKERKKNKIATKRIDDF